MPLLDDPHHILFPVKLAAVFAAGVQIPGKSAIIDTTNGRPIGVVSAGYRLITNEEALAAARKCCHEVFPETQPSEWEMTVAETPSTRSYCHIDLNHKTAHLDFEYLLTGTREGLPDSFGPFIRVTNSYNGSRALAFSIGFNRKTCENGMVAPETVISFKFNHTHKDIKKNIAFVIKHKEIKEMKRDFLKYFRALRDCRIEKCHFRPLIVDGLQFRKPKRLGESSKDSRASKKLEAWNELISRIDSIAAKYIRQQGENAYAVLNSITDLASHPQSNVCIQRDRNSLQVLAGEWLVDFSRECRKKPFSVAKYLEEAPARRQNRPTARRGRPVAFN